VQAFRPAVTATRPAVTPTRSPDLHVCHRPAGRLTFMCGIAGLVRYEGLAPGDVAAVERMTAAQVHRGPDGNGFYSDQVVALGHCRLSIIDTSAAGKQPMWNEDRTVWVTYNGEIYNHQELRRELASLGHAFRSRTDTEVIVHGYEQWGPEGLLERLRGMFAFGLYDSRKGLTLARDRFGIKPLYYFAGRNGLLLFASEVRALLASGYVPDERDLDAMAGFLLAGSVAAPRTVVQGVSSLLPGHYMICRRAGTAVRRYWDLRCCQPRSGQERREPGNERPPIAHIRSLLQDSVSRHLVSDVPLGVFLSGGVDSGAVVAFGTRVRSATPPLTTLTVTFDEQEFSERGETEAVASRFHTDHHEIRVTRADFVSELPKILAAMDQPTNDGVNTYFVSRAARQVGLTVALSGLGGDEVFRGYRHYRSLERHARWLVRCPSPARRALSQAAVLWGRVGGRDKWMRLAFLEHGASSPELYLLVRGFFPPRHVMNLLDISARDLDVAVEQQFDGLRPGASAETGANGFNYIEFKRYLHDQLLRDTDVFSMAHSIEVRVPFLDHVVVEQVAQADSALKMANGVNKPLLVGAADDPWLLRAGRAKKRGFSFPMDRWMKASADDLEEMAAATSFLNPRAVRTLWKGFRDNRVHWSRAWALTVLGAASVRSAPRSASIVDLTSSVDPTSAPGNY
jgi:asparagine synthase (glutamine-hydrolysing)